MARSKGEGSIYYIEKRKKWSAQYTITVGDKQVRKTVYGNTKREVADKLLDLRVKMYKIEIMETDITNLIKETQELPKKLRIQVKLKYMAIGMIVSTIISSILIIVLK